VSVAAGHADSKPPSSPGLGTLLLCSLCFSLCDVIFILGDPSQMQDAMSMSGYVFVEGAVCDVTLVAMIHSA
jgi:hypothetical protein